jgi:hypothetical protein
MPHLIGLKKHAIVMLAVALWIPLVGYGMGILWRYSNTPGPPATPPPGWPASVPVRPMNGRATLIMFAHPNCPCSRSSIGELAIIMARASEKLDAHVFFYLPSTEASTWARTDLWETATAIPGVHVIEDREGALARRFGVHTSGQTLLYNAAGRLIFNGGITAARGHSGDNNGRHAVIKLAQGRTVVPNATPVFGCSLKGE